MAAVTAAVMLMAVRASAAVVTFEDATCDDAGFCGPVVVGDYVIDSPEFITKGYSSSLPGAPDGPYLDTTIGGFTISRVDERPFYLDGLVGGYIPIEGRVEPGLAALTVAYVGTSVVKSFTSDALAPFSIDVDAFGEAVTEVSFFGGGDSFQYLQRFEARLAPSPVPLPASAMLLGAALTGLGLARRRAT